MSTPDYSIDRTDGYDPEKPETHQVTRRKGPRTRRLAALSADGRGVRLARIDERLDQVRRDAVARFQEHRPS